MSQLAPPPPVLAFVEAVNGGDLNAIVATFADDAFVNDQLLEYWGKKEIASWASRDIVSVRLTIRIIHSFKHYDQVIVRAQFEGEFDRRGLPDPLSLTLYCTVQEEKITQLIILRDQSGTCTWRPSSDC